MKRGKAPGISRCSDRSRRFNPHNGLKTGRTLLASSLMGDAGQSRPERDVQKGKPVRKSKDGVRGRHHDRVFEWISSERRTKLLASLEQNETIIHTLSDRRIDDSMAVRVGIADTSSPCMTLIYLELESIILLCDTG